MDFPTCTMETSTKEEGGHLNPTVGGAHVDSLHAPYVLYGVTVLA